jgi:hypothetical protein
MKWSIILTILLITLLTKTYDSKKYHKKNGKVLPLTPKGNWLRNHFGTWKVNNYYGPKPLNHQPLNGSKKLESNNAEVWYLGNDGLCAHDPYYRLCYEIKSCDLCTASPHCGWCTRSRTCEPGVARYSNCAGHCLNNWIFNGECGSGEVKSGFLGNIAPESLKLRNPLVALPIAHVHTNLHHQGVVKRRYPMGYKIKKHHIAAYNHGKGRVEDQEISIASPVIAEMHTPTVITTKQTKTIDMATGKYKPRPNKRGMVGLASIKPVKVEEVKKDTVPKEMGKKTDETEKKEVEKVTTGTFTPQCCLTGKGTPLNGTENKNTAGFCDLKTVTTYVEAFPTLVGVKGDLANETKKKASCTTLNATKTELDTAIKALACPKTGCWTEKTKYENCCMTATVSPNGNKVAKD